jgi:hypothetical protein
MTDSPAIQEQSGGASPASTVKSTTASAPSKKSWTTAAFLAMLVVAVNSWTTRHLGWGLESAFGITSLAVGLGLVATIGEKLLPDEEIKALKVSVSRIPVALVVGLWIAFACLATLRSSVVVLGDSSEKAFSAEGVRLTKVDTGEVVPVTQGEGKDASLRFGVSTSLFGRVYRLKVPGYIAQVVQVYPFTGLTVVPETDLRVSPSVLFRPPTNALQELNPKSGGKFQILKIQKNALSSLTISCQKSSYLFGREQGIPAAWAGLWDLELKVSHISDVPADEASTKLAWYRYTVLTPPHDLEPGDFIEARVISGGNAVIARARVKLGSEPLKDVALVAESSPRALTGSEVPSCPTE